MKESKTRLRVSVGDRTDIVFAMDGDHLLGIRDVRQDGVPLRNPRALWRPLIATPDGISYVQFILKGIRQTAGGGLVVRLDAIGAHTGIIEEQDEYLGDVVNLSPPDQPVRDRLEWIFSPDRLSLDGQDFSGFSFRYRFVSHAGRAIRRIFDDATWEIGGKVAGNTLLLQGEVNPPVTALTREGYFTTACNYYPPALRGKQGPPRRVSFQRLPRLGTIQAFDYLTHDRGTLLGLFAPGADVLSVVQKETGEDWLHVLDEWRGPLSAAFETTPKRILFRPAEGDGKRESQRNLWVRAYDLVHEGVRQHYGVARSPVQPRIWIPQVADEHFVLDGQTFPRAELLRVLADRRMDTWADMGVKEICTHSLWTSDYTVDRKAFKDQHGMHGGLYVGSICNVRAFTIDPLWGGPEALAYFTDAAHRRGIQVQVWWATHMSRRADIFTRRPDFMLLARDGLPNGGGFGHQSIITFDLNNPEAFDWMAAQVAAVQRQTGFDGVFHDSYGNMTFLPINHADPLRRGQQDAYGRLVRTLQESGIRTFTVEGMGPLGTGHFAITPVSPTTPPARPFQFNLNWWLGQEDMTYGLNLGIGLGPWSGRPDPLQSAFRCLAGGGRLCLSGRDGITEIWTGRLRDLNRIHARLGTLTGRRILLPEDQGVCWERDGGDTLLFAFRRFVADAPAGTTVTEETGDGPRPVKVTGGRFTARPGTVYRKEPS
jgi:hypothetical protein